MFETVMCLTDELDWNVVDLDDDDVKKDLTKLLYECFGDDLEIGAFYCIDGRSVDDIIINPPATIVKWADGTKTVVKCQNNEEYDAEKGIALCFMKKMCGNKSSYNEIIKTAIAVNEARQNKK